MPENVRLQPRRPGRGVGRLCGKRFALAKARAGWEDFRGRLRWSVLRADTAVVVDERVLSKPRDRACLWTAAWFWTTWTATSFKRPWSAINTTSLPRPGPCGRPARPYAIASRNATSRHRTDTATLWLEGCPLTAYLLAGTRRLKTTLYVGGNPPAPCPPSSAIAYFLI